MATNDFALLEVQRPGGESGLLDAAANGADPPLIALVREVIAAEWPDMKITLRQPTTGWWSLDVGAGLTRGMSIQVFAKKEGPVAATVALAPNTRLASVLTTASGISFFLLSLAGMSYFFFAGGLSAKMAILLGGVSGASVAGPLFGLAWLVDNVLNPLGPRAVAQLREKLGARVVASFPPSRSTGP